MKHILIFAVLLGACSAESAPDDAACTRAAGEPGVLLGETCAQPCVTEADCDAAQDPCRRPTCSAYPGANTKVCTYWDTCE